MQAYVGNGKSEVSDRSERRPVKLGVDVKVLCGWLSDEKPEPDGEN